MTSVYRSLHDNYISNKGRKTSCAVLVGVLGCLVVLGIILAIAVLERPPKNKETFPQEPAGDNSFNNHCRLQVVESIPEDVYYSGNVTFGRPLEQVWKDLLSMATERVEVTSFYWTLTGEDINVNTSSDLSGRDILTGLGELPSRNVSVRVVTSVPTVKTNSTDLKILKQKGVQVRWVNFGRLAKGVLHSKFWIVDRKHLFIGSANMDWRALTQVEGVRGCKLTGEVGLGLLLASSPAYSSEVKELGVVVYNCSSLATDLHKIFQSYWVMGQPNSSLPQQWPSKFDTNFNKHRPLLVRQDNISSLVYIAASPPPFCPSSRTQDLEAILGTISEAQYFIDGAVMEYSPTVRFLKPQKYWPLIDDAIRTAAFERRVKVRLLVSCGRDSDPAMLPFLQSLASVHSPEHHIYVQIKLFIIPVGNHSDIPFSRVNHNKYMVTDKIAYVGTSNWAGDYFLTTAGVSLVVSQYAPYPAKSTDTLHGQIKEIFDRDWNSEFAVNLADLGHHPDCALSR